MEGVKYESIWKHFKIQDNVDMCKKCEQILLGEKDLSLRKHLNLHHQINMFNDGKFPVGTIPFLHDHFRFGMMATCNYCCKTEKYLKILNKINIHLRLSHEEARLTENVYKVLTFFEIECERCSLLGIRLHRTHSSLIRHLEVKHPEKLPYDE